MGFIEEMKWWHWIVVSLFLGAVVGYLNTTRADEPPSYASMNRMTFEAEVTDPPAVIPLTGKKVPWLMDITVYPPRASPLGGIDQLVTLYANEQPFSQGPRFYAFLAPIPYEAQPLGWGRRPHPGTVQFRAEKGDTFTSIETKYYGRPSKEGGNAILHANQQFRDAHRESDIRFIPGRTYYVPWNPAKNYTVVDWLQAAKKAGADVTYRDMWWVAPKYSYPITMGASLLFIGIIWPFLIQMMMKGGFARPQDTEKFRLRSYKPVAQESKPAAAQTELTAQDRDRLRELEESLTASLAKGAADSSSDTPPPAAAPPDIKKLQGEAAPTAATPEQQTGPKHYGGEYYPVERPAHEPHQPG